MHDESPAPPRRPSTLRRLLFLAASALLLAYPIILLWTTRPYPLDLIAHFGPHAAAALALLAILFFLFRARRLAIVALVSALACLAIARAGYRAPAARVPGAPTIRVVHYNAKGDTSDAFARWLREQDADLVCLVEASWTFVAQNPWAAERFPFRIEPRKGLEWSMVLLSRFPTDPARVLDEKGEQTHWQSFLGRRSVVVTLDPSTRFLFGGTHPPSPRTAQTWRMSLAQVATDASLLRAWRERTGLPALVLGDFNSSSTGRVHRLFAAVSRLRPWGRLSAGTWPASLPPALAVPIDKAWTSPELRVVSFRVGPRFGSDHRPIIIEVQPRP